MYFTPAGLEHFFRQLAAPVAGDDLHDAPQTRPDMAKMGTLTKQFGLP